MKKRIHFISVMALLVSLFIVTSCKKDKTDDTPPTNTPNTVEQNKAILEQSGINFVNQLDIMDQNTGIEALVQLGKLQDKDDFSAGVLGKKNGSKSYNSDFMQIVYVFGKLAKNQIPISDIYTKMDLTSSAKGGIQDDYNSLKGIYDWDYLSQTWVKQATASNSVVINFPFTSSGTNNNVTFTNTDFTTQTVVLEGNSVEVPVLENWNLKVDGVTKITFTFSSVYVNNRPTSINSALTISPFALTLGVNCSDTQCTSTYSILNGTQTIFGFSAEANGNWSQDNLDQYIYDRIDSTWDYYNNIWVYDTIEGDSVAFDKIVEDANVSCTIMNIKIAGVVEFKNLYLTMNTIDNTNYPTDQAEQNAIAAALNDYMQLVVVNTDDNSNIATGEAYVSSENDTSYVWNGTTWVLDPHVDYFIDLRLVFHDGSKIDIETYSNSGFGAFIDKINLFMNDLAGKYNFQYDNIVYGKKK